MRLDQRLDVPVRKKVAQVQPSNRPEIEPGTSWLAVRNLSNCANFTHTSVNEQSEKTKRKKLYSLTLYSTFKQTVS